MPNKFPIFVNSCDSFEDCWHPFFALLHQHWPGVPPKIYLNTETKDFAFPGLDITCLKVGMDAEPGSLPWGECVIRALDKIDDDIILYIHEDCFIDRLIQADVIENFVDLMNQMDIANIRLIEFDGSGPWHPTESPMLWEVDQKSAYRLSTQACLWRRDRLRSYIRRHENPWQFEIWGSKRASRVRDRIFCINKDLFDANAEPVLSYAAADAVKKGKWNLDVVEDLFSRHEITVDFSQRGLFSDDNCAVSRASLFQRASARLRSYW